MATSVMVMGESGTGKSTALRNIDPDKTFIIQAVGKPLPFKSKFKRATKEGGQVVISDDYVEIIRLIKKVNDNAPHITNFIIDDFQYIMANEFMRRADEKGYAKFTELAQHTWKILEAIQDCRADLNFFVLTHSELDASNRYKAKTIGKLLDEKITLEGLFTIVLHTQILEEKYLFLTQNDGRHIAKSPVGMFESKYIENDLQHVIEKIDSYYNQEL